MIQTSPFYHFPYSIYVSLTLFLTAYPQRFKRLLFVSWTRCVGLDDRQLSPTLARVCVIRGER